MLDKVGDKVADEVEVAPPRELLVAAGSALTKGSGFGLN
jgi:hypothetical protein